jgi:hypothetical protein
MPGCLAALESVLVPEWDTQTMEHVVLGWQTSARVRLADELGVTGLEAAEAARVFGDRYGSLALTPDTSLQDSPPHPAPSTSLSYGTHRPPNAAKPSRSFCWRERPAGCICSKCRAMRQN